MSFVYIAPLTDKVAFKIGASRTPEIRLANLSAYYTFDMANVFLIDCLTHEAAYELESMLQTICEHHRILFNHDGGTEFFKYSIYDDLLVALHPTLKLKGYIMKRLELRRVIAVPQPEANNVALIAASLATTVRNKRLLHDITRPQLASVSGVSYNTIKNMEHGKDVTLSSVIKVFCCLGLDHIFSPLESTPTHKQRARGYSGTNIKP